MAKMSAFDRLLRDADGTGSPDLNVDGSVTPVHFDFLADPGGDTYLHSVRLVMADGAIQADTFGGISGGLDNGLLVSLVYRLVTILVAVGGIPFFLSKSLVGEGKDLSEGTSH